MDNEGLISVITGLEDMEEVTNALTELAIRDREIVGPYCLAILEEDWGDEYLQAVAFHLLCEADDEKAKTLLTQKLLSAPAALLGEIMDKLSVDRFQPYGESLSADFLQSVAGRFSELGEDGQTRIRKNYEWFKESYKDKLL